MEIPNPRFTRMRGTMQTAKRRAYDKVRQSILNREFLPGHQLKEEELSEFCNASRTPVRQAITMLADEGLVTIRANRRSYVTDVTYVQMEETYDMLAFLEGYSASLAAKRISPKKLQALKAISEDMEAIVLNSPEDYKNYLELNSAFHKLIHLSAGNEKLYELIYKISNFSKLLFLKFGKINFAHNKKSLEQHRNIIEALESGDAEFSKLQMTLHTESVRRSFKELWRKWENEN